VSHHNEVLVGGSPLIFSKAYLRNSFFAGRRAVARSNHRNGGHCHGRYLREAAVSAVSLVDAISQLFIQIFASFATEAPSSHPVPWQKGQTLGLHRGKQLVYISLIVSVALVMVGIPTRGPLLRFIFGSIEADVMTNADIYFEIILI
jgi:Na+-driven multidrug efflux pump